LEAKLALTPENARELLDKARLGQLSNEECENLTTMGQMDELRPFVQEEDLGWILPDLLTYSDERAAFQISLTAKFAIREDVKLVLRNSWEAANVHQKSHLLWRILDDPMLPQEWHGKLFDFVQSEWGQFQKTCSRFYGGTPDGIIAGTVERYVGSNFPQSKKWAYLCNLATVKKSPATVEFFLQQALRSNHAFERKVAESLKVILGISLQI
jgi:hypothetical protein